MSVMIVLDAQDGTDGLRKVVNSHKYVLISPPESWIYPGGFVVEAGNTATFTDLPDGLKPTPADAKVDFPAVNTTRKFSLGLIASGMLGLISGAGLDVGHQGSLTFKEVAAHGKRITYDQAEDVVANGQLKSTIASWLDTQKVYIVFAAFSTQELSVTTNSAWNGDISFGGAPLKTCPASSDSSKSGTDQSNSQAQSAAPDASKSGSSTKFPNSGGSTPSNDTAPKPQQAAAPKPPTGDSAGASKNSAPGGQALFCKTGTDTLTMNSAEPLYFTAILAPVTKDKTGNPQVQPVQILTRKGAFSSAQGKSVTAEMVNGFPDVWGHDPWPGHK
jgi:hypothetical protein